MHPRQGGAPSGTTSGDHLPGLEPPVTRDARRAGHLLWLAFWTMLASVGIGLPWDAAWHVSRRFDTAFSPPHLFVYVTTALTAAFFLALLTTPALRRSFGRGFHVPLVRYPVPGPLFLVGVGLGLLAFGALLDIAWHTAFGLDETRWSAPHAMLGWGWGVASFGFVGARLALRPHRPLHWWTRVFLGLVLIGFSIGPVLGPFQHNQTAEKVAAIAAIPVLAEQSAFQHTTRIYLDWQIVRSHPVFVVLGAVWVGVSLALVQTIDRRAVFVFGVLGFWTVAALLRDRGAAIRLGLNVGQLACWLPIPLLPAALASFLARRAGQGEVVAASVGGAVFGALSQLIWPTIGPIPGAVLGVPFAVLGSMLGGKLAELLEQPTQRGCAALAAVALVAPFATGLVDLYLRLRTPWS